MLHIYPNSFTFLQPVINSRVNVNVAIAIARPLARALLFVALPPLHVLIVIGQRDVEIEGLVPLGEPEADEGVLPAAVLDPEHEVAGGVEDGLDGALPLPREDEAGGEELAGPGVLEADLAAVLAGDDAEAAGPDLVGLEPLAALVPAGGGARRDLVHGYLPDDEERVLQRLLVVLGLEGHCSRFPSVRSSRRRSAFDEDEDEGGVGSKLRSLCLWEEE